jgi:hypothetical protein
MTMKGNLAARAKSFMKDPLLPDEFKDPATWPEPMRKEWSNDEGWAASEEHRRLLIENFRWIRSELDAFNPDVVLIWGDDQYENFRESIVPAFALMAYAEFVSKPWGHLAPGRENSWDEPKDKEFRFAGHQKAGKYLANRLIADGFDIAYCYEPNHGEGFGHAFANTALYLDWDRRGLPYALLPLSTNCYGRPLTKLHGSVLNNLADLPNEDEVDPSSPHPWRCFDMGRSIAKAMQESPWRVALMASSSWSHNFLTGRYHYFHPDVPTDKRYFEALKNGDYDLWRNTTIEEVELAGHNELLNWYALCGAMSQLGRKPDEAHFVESWLCNSDKVFAVFRP